MSTIHDDPSSETTEEDRLATLLGEVRKLGTRLSSLENRIDDLADRINEPDKHRAPIPSLALRNDGKVLLSVEHIDGADVADRERWEGVVLSDRERLDVFKGMKDGADDVAAHIAGRILARTRKGKNEPGEGGGDAQG